MKHLTFALLALFATFPAFAGEPDLSSPAATVRSFLIATKANDVEAAKKCWIIDDNNASGALDVVVGKWVESRKLVAATDAKFGAEGVKLLGRWNQPACTDKAIDRTLDRLGSAEVREGRGIARVVVAWQPNDGGTEPAFLYQAPFRVKHSGDHWRLDANVFTGEEKAADLYATGKVWPIWRDEIAVMRDMTALIEKGQLKDVVEFEKELKARVDALKAKYERKD